MNRITKSVAVGSSGTFVLRWSSLSFGLAWLACGQAEPLDTRASVIAKDAAAEDPFARRAALRANHGTDSLLPIPGGDARYDLLYLTPGTHALPTPAENMGARQHARSIFELAEEVRGVEPALAFQLLHEVLYFDPQHKSARQICGVAQPKPQAADGVRVQRGRQRHSQYGWPAGSYWRVETDHYLISTNHSEEAGRRLAAALEPLYVAWRQLFFEYWSDARQLGQAWSAERSLPRPRHKFLVVLFRDQAEYARQLREWEPKIEMSLGFYRAQKKTAYFYASDDGPLQSTWLHEATHQLFQETRTTRERPGEESNFWIIEGVALYMESLRATQLHATVGGATSERLQFARYRVFQDQFYLPLEQLVTFGRTSLQRHAELRRLYSQAAGLVHFLMHHSPEYRRRLVQYVRSVYTDASDADLFAIMEVEGAELDRQYREFLQVSDRDMDELKVFRDVSELCLGHSQISRAALQLGGLTHLRWLDLTHTEADDATIAQLTSPALKQLFLEGTAIGDEALRHIGGLAELEELDLTGTRITDEGLRALAACRQLRVLWLAKTHVTDDGLKHLEPLQHLETLNLQGTSVTPEAVRRLQEKLPRLQTSK